MIFEFILFFRQFQHPVKPGVNAVVRKSTDSSVTIPSENYFHPEIMRENIKKNTTNNSTYCLTGWPSHLLIPIGTQQGAEFLLFAMVTKDDKVKQRSAFSFSFDSKNKFCLLCAFALDV